MSNRVIDLLGPKGNAYYLQALAQDLSKQLSLDWKKINKEMISGDYAHLIDVFQKYFSDYIKLQNIPA